MLEQDIQFVNYENAHEVGPFVGIATRGGEGAKRYEKNEFYSRSIKLLTRFSTFRSPVFVR